jgi:hypothetical protein
MLDKLWAPNVRRQMLKEFAPTPPFFVGRIESLQFRLVGDESI